MAFLIYLAQVSLYAAIMLAIYIAVWRNRPLHYSSRRYLICSLLLPLVLPLIRLPISTDSPIARYGIALPDTVVRAGGVTKAAPSFSWQTLAIPAYAGVAILLALLYVMRYVQVLRQIRKGTKIRHDSYTIVTNSGIGPGTLGRCIFFPGEIMEDAILRHELAHIRAGHRYDLALLQVMRIVCWASPAHWLIGRELKLVHEYEADRAATSSGSTAEYGQLLLSQSLGLHNISIGHSFFHHPLKRRIDMLQLSQHPQRKLAVYALASIMMITFSAMVVLAQSKKETAIAKKPAAVEVSPTEDRINKVPMPDAKILPDGRVVFTQVDRMPEFKNNLWEWLSSRLHYPDSARAHGEQGRAVVQFIVDENGRLGMPTVIHSSGHDLLDNEALRVVREMPQWNAGTQKGLKVPVLFTLPISFKLDGDGKLVGLEGC